MSLIHESQFSKAGLTTTVQVHKHLYDNIELRFTRYLEDSKGNPIIDNKYTMFFSEREFTDFLYPFVSSLKEIFENETIKHTRI